MGPSTTHRNISEICRIESESLKRRSISDRIGDLVAAQAGQIRFVIAHAVWFITWIVLNANVIPRLPPFDPYPFSLLTMVVSLESIFLSLFILMSQSRANRQADERNHLDLQINLLSEHESTKTLQMLQALCAYHGLKIANDPEVNELAERTEPRELLKELRANLPETE
jgi:uncharacterized membrane protein